MFHIHIDFIHRTWMKAFTERLIFIKKLFTSFNITIFAHVVPWGWTPLNKKQWLMSLKQQSQTNLWNIISMICITLLNWRHWEWIKMIDNRTSCHPYCTQHQPDSIDSYFHINCWWSTECNVVRKYYFVNNFTSW